MATKNQNELLSYLGSEYSLKEIDFEMCIYREINSNYDIEISGTHRKNHPLSVYVWNISNGKNTSAQIVDSESNINSKSQLKEILNRYIRKYQDLT